MIGLPVTARTESAAPPRASPSSLVITTPSKSATSAKLSATLTASWPVIASTTRRTSCGLATFRTSRQLVHQLLVDVQAAGRVDDQHVAVLLDGLLARPLGDLDRRRSRPAASRRGPWPGRRASRAARPPPAAAGRRRPRRRPCSACPGAWRASRMAVVLPEPWRPAHQDHRGAARGEDQVAAGAAHQRGELVVDRLDHRLARVERLRDLLAGEALLERGGEVLDDLEVDVGLEQREPHLAEGLVHVVLGELARANERRRARPEGALRAGRTSRSSLERRLRQGAQTGAAALDNPVGQHRRRDKKVREIPGGWLSAGARLSEGFSAQPSPAHSRPQTRGRNAKRSFEGCCPALR